MPFSSLRRFLLPGLLAVFLAGGAGRPAAAGSQELAGRGAALMSRGEYAEALEPLHQARQALPFDPAVRRLLAECYFGLGLQHLEARRYGEAAETLREGRAYAKDEARFWLFRGYALLRAGRYGEAEGEIGEALALSGEEPQALRLLGQVYYDSGRLHQAVQAWEQALEQDPGSEELVALLAKTRRELRVEEGMAGSHGGNFSVSWDGEVSDELGGEILEALEDAYSEIGADLGFYPEVRVPVLAYARRDFAELTGSPDWAGGLYDGKIRIPLGGVTGMTPELKAVLWHEYSHVAVRFLARGRAPLWLNEGVAEVAGRRHHDPPLHRLEQAAREGRLLPLERLEGSLAGLAAEEVHLAYQQSYSLVRHLVERYGWHKVRDLLEAFGTESSAAAAVQTALGEFGIDYEGLQQEWRHGLERGR